MNATNVCAFLIDVVVLQETLSVMAACMRQDLTIRHSKCLRHCIPPDVGHATRGFYRTVAVCSRGHFSYTFLHLPGVGPCWFEV